MTSLHLTATGAELIGVHPTTGRDVVLPVAVGPDREIPLRGDLFSLAKVFGVEAPRK